MDTIKSDAVTNEDKSPPHDDDDDYDDDEDNKNQVKAKYR